MSKSKNKMVRRSYQFDVNAVENEQGAAYITGRPIVYESKTNLGEFDEIIKNGALNNADLHDVRFLVNHDVSKIPLARSRNNNENSTMRLYVDDTGLRFETFLDIENNAEAKSLYSAVKRGDITGMSFMFSVENELWEDLAGEHPTRNITKISSVIEVSAVTFPAYDDTEITARNKSALDNARSVLENVVSEKRKLDNDFLALEKEKNENRMKFFGGKKQ